MERDSRTNYKYPRRYPDRRDSTAENRPADISRLGGGLYPYTESAALAVYKAIVDYGLNVATPRLYILEEPHSGSAPSRTGYNRAGGASQGSCEIVSRYYPSIEEEALERVPCR